MAGRAGRADDEGTPGVRADDLGDAGHATTPVAAPVSASVPVPVVVTSAVRVPPALPDPADVARSLALCVAEILSGAREVDTIARWVTEEVHRHLQHRAAVAARARSVTRRSAGRPVIRVGGVVLGRPREDVVEAAVVVHTRSHARAVAIRLETRGDRWRATAIGVL